MLAESVHSVADSGNQVLLLIGRTRAERTETEEHPFGFGAERYFYAFMVAVVLFTVGAAFSCYEGIDRIRHPEKLTSPYVAFAVLGIAIVLEGFSLRTAVKESNRSRRGARWRSFIRHAKAPELAGDPAGGRSRSSAGCCWRSSASPSRRSPTATAGTAPARWQSACCSAASPWCWRRR